MGYAWTSRLRCRTHHYGFQGPSAMSDLFMTATFLLMAATVVAGTLVSLLLS
jgi:hypothetical protein